MMGMANNSNPFNPGSGSMPPYLAGRTVQIETFEKMLADITTGHDANMLLYGLRGVGKSTLLAVFKKIATDAGFAVIARNQFDKKHTIPENFITALSFDIEGALHKAPRARKLADDVKSAAKIVKPKKVEFMGLSIEPSYETGKRLAEDVIKERLIQGWKILSKSECKGMLITFDEFHEVVDVGRNESILSDFLGALYDLQNENVPCYAVLAGLPNLPLNVKGAKSYTERMFSIVKVEYLQNDQTRDAITLPLQSARRTFDPELVEALVRETGNYPYFIQYYCKEILSRIEKKNVQLADFESIREMIEERLDGDFFDGRFEKASDSEQKVLFAMASFGLDNVRISDLADSGVTESTIKKSLMRLERKGMVYRHIRGQYRLSLPLFGRYLRRKNR